MEMLDIENIIINNFNKMIKNENYSQEKIQEHINKIKEGLNIIKQNDDLKILEVLYLIKKFVYGDLIKINKKILVKDNYGIFNDITTGIIFSLDDEKPCYIIQVQNKDEKDRHVVLEIPREIKDKVIKVLSENYNNWEDKYYASF